MQNLASKLALVASRVGLTAPPDIVKSVEDDARSKVLRASNTFVDAARVRQDHMDAAAAIRFMRAESRKRWKARADEFIPPALAPAAAPRKGPPPRHYSPDRAYVVGEELRYDAFGDGVVIATERRRITVKFDSGEITLMVLG